MDLSFKKTVILIYVMVSIFIGVSYSLGMGDELTSEHGKERSVPFKAFHTVKHILPVLQNSELSLKKRIYQIATLIGTQHPDEKNASIDGLIECFYSPFFSLEERGFAATLVFYFGDEQRKDPAVSFLQFFVENDAISYKERIYGLSALLDDASTSEQKKKWLSILDSIFLKIPRTETENIIEAARNFLIEREATDAQRERGISVLLPIVTNEHISQEYRLDAAQILFENLDDLEKTAEARRLLMSFLKEERFALSKKRDIVQIFYDKGTSEEQIDRRVLELMLTVKKLPSEECKIIRKQLAS